MTEVKIRKVGYSQKFLKQLKKAPLPIQVKFRDRFGIFIKDQFDSQLNNHLLTGKFKGYRSINITGDWRAIYIQDGDKIVFVLLGTHSQLYK